jgi:hypothetical protein
MSIEYVGIFEVNLVAWEGLGGEAFVTAVDLETPLRASIKERSLEKWLQEKNI